MNIHPLFVHFPIALLTLYALLEIASCFFPQDWKKTDTVLHIKMFLVIVGGLSLLPTLLTGGISGDLRGGGSLIEMHETFAQITTVIFGLLAGGYTLWLFDSLGWSKSLSEKHVFFEKIFLYGRKLVDIIMHMPVRIALALLGIVAITVTGGLGASIAYSPDVDPVVHFIYNLVM